MSSKGVESIIVGIITVIVVWGLVFILWPDFVIRLVGGIIAIAIGVLVIGVIAYFSGNSGSSGSAGAI